MRLAALVPTRNRPDTALRAIASFLGALAAAGTVREIAMVVADDSDDSADAERLDLLLNEVRVLHRSAAIEVLRPSARGRNAGGPGRARNRALAVLRERVHPVDATVMFDDDMAFGDTEYRGSQLACEGSALLSTALAACDRPGTIVGCGYVGRQDMSVLEHIRMNDRAAGGANIAPALDRGGIESFAPGGISTAFLMIGAAPEALPDFAEHYNEDYLWIDAMQRRGWSIQKLAHSAIHAPPGDVDISADILDFQIFGEIVWLAVTDRDRYPVTDISAMASAIEEIVGDLRTSTVDPGVSTRSDIASWIGEILDRYQSVGRLMRAGTPCDTGRAILAAIDAGNGVPSDT